MDERFSKRFESFKKSLTSLAQARHRDLSDDFVQSGTGAKFSITFDLSWKVLKDVVIQRYDITDFIAGSPREVLRTAFKNQLICGDEWMEMLKVRNELAHDYDGDFLLENCKKIIEIYIPKLEELQTKITKLLQES